MGLKAVSKGWPGNLGTITSIVAGTGLTGGTITTSGTIAVAFPLTSAPGTAAYANTTAFDAAGAAAAVTPTTLGLVIGTNVQAYNSNLTAINQALTTTSSPTFASVNGITETALATGFSLSGGTSSKTLTVDKTIKLSTMMAIAAHMA